jgi:RNA polymerase sigma factor (sigma-70 family)
MKISKLENPLMHSKPDKHFKHSELLHGIRERNEAVISYIDLVFKRKMVNHIVRLGGTVEDGLDAFQDAMVIIIQNVNDKPSFEIKASFKSYFLTVGIKTYLKQKNRSHKSVPLESVAEPENGEKPIYDILNYRDLYNIVLEQLYKIRELCRKILLLHMDRKSPEQIAQSLNLDVKRVYDHKNKCKGELINMVKKHPEYKRIERVEAKPVKGDK